MRGGTENFPMYKCSIYESFKLIIPRDFLMQRNISASGIFPPTNLSSAQSTNRPSLQFYEFSHTRWNIFKCS